VLNGGLAGQRDTVVKVVASVSGPLEVKTHGLKSLDTNFSAWVGQAKSRAGVDVHVRNQHSPAERGPG